MDGSVLIAGGNVGWPDATPRAELFHPDVATAAPVLYQLPSDAARQGAVQHAGSARLASATDPAAAGEALAIYGTGLAENCLIPPRVSIGGRLAEVLWFGKTPGYDALNQINVRVPEGIHPGSDVPVRLMYLGRFSNEVTIGIQ
jgi:uncharacterized protein (TIGR03437 family)